MEKGGKSKKRVFFISAKESKIFEFLKSGKKKVETRAATPRALLVQAGDTAVFICKKERLEKKIKKVRHFKTIASLLKAHSFKSINPGINQAKELVEMYERFPGYVQKIREHGIVAFELE